MLFEDRTFRCTRRGYKLKKFQEINSKYVKIPNELVDDRNLSWKAKGLFCHMASKPDSYNFTVSSLSSQFPDGRFGNLSALDELKERGWITYIKRANGQGKYKLETSIEPKSDYQTQGEPKSGYQTKKGEPKSGYPELGFRTVQKPDCISNTDALNNTNLSKGRERNFNSKDQQHDYAVISKPSTRYDIETLINEEIFGSN